MGDHGSGNHFTANCGFGRGCRCGVVEGALWVALGREIAPTHAQERIARPGRPFPRTAAGEGGR